MRRRCGIHRRWWGRGSVAWRANRRLKPTEQALLGSGHVLLQTRLGPLDCLGELVDENDFDRLREHTVLVSDVGQEFPVLDLPTLIDIKRKTNRAKDRIMLPILIALAKELGSAPES